MAARAVADPSDQFSCVMALRSRCSRCGDDDLWTWRQARGTFSIAGTDRRRPEHVGPSTLWRMRWSTCVGCTTDPAG